jgi:hypothetical protein
MLVLFLVTLLEFELLECEEDEEELLTTKIKSESTDKKVNFIIKIKI